MYSRRFLMVEGRPQQSFQLAEAAWILFSGLHFVFGLIFSLALSTAHGDSPLAKHPPAFVATTATLLLAGPFGILTGVHLLLRRSWARSVVVFWSAGLVAIGSSALVIFLAAFGDRAPENGAAAVGYSVILSVTGTYLALGAWWFLKFTNLETLAHFGSVADQQRCWTSRWQNLRILALYAGYLIFGGMILLLYVRVQLRAPILFFGLPLIGISARIFALVSGLLDVALGIAILLRKPSAINVTVATTLLYVLGNLVTLLSPGTEHRMQEAVAVMASRGIPVTAHDPFTHVRFRQELSISIEALSLLILASYRKRFLDGPTFPLTAATGLPESSLIS